MRVLCEKAEPVAAAAAALRRRAAMRLVALNGAPSIAPFLLERAHVNLGRESEVVDSLGRAIRRNDLFFPEDTHEANGSVSRSHAHIRFDGSSGEWRIYDDGSSLGTILS